MSVDIDESLYSRQLYVIGKEAMTKLSQSSVLILGLSGMGVEVAKNVILSGVKNIMLCDVENISTLDLYSNYYASKDDIGKNRVNVVKEKLSSLNPYVNLQIKTNTISKNEIIKYQTVVVCDNINTSEIVNMDLKALNVFCRNNHVNFIVANSCKSNGFIFCDFGENFVVNDIDGEEAKTGIIIEVKDNIIKTSEPHQLYSDDVVNINLNGNQTTDIVEKIIDSFTFCVKKNLVMAENFVSNSKFFQEKQKLKIKFVSLEESLNNPTFTNVILDDFERQDFLFKYNRNKFENFHTNNLDVLIEKMGVNNDDKNLNLVKKLLFGETSKLCPVDSIIGSITAQEVIKSVSCKFTPINQWMFLDFTSIIDVNVNNKIFKDKLKEQDIFIVGAGALGCELLKNLAMIGIGNITITDMDIIEKSNLNRQFLFRNTDIGKFKSECARDAVLKMKPNINITAQKLKVASETLSVYDQSFFKSKTAILTALDNVQARKFVDSLCVENNKPLVDSGTLGTKGNVQVIIPHLSEPYSASNDPPEKEVPLCTIKNFPYLIDHTIQWARDLFEGYFVKAPENYMRYKNNPHIKNKLAESEQCEIAKDVNFICNNIACDSEDCILFAYKIWHELFRDQVYHLREKFPENNMTKENIPFWSGTKKFPQLFEFNIQNEEHVEFIEATANLWADIFNIKHTNKNQILKMLKNKKSPKIKEMAEDIKIEKEDEKKETEINKSANFTFPEIEELDFDIAPLSFEKDDDSNFHINFVTSTSNLRATNYKIEKADKLKTKGIAGKIIPAIATTTSLVCGLVTIELIKIIQNKHKIEDFTNSFVNLALPFMCFSEPVAVKKTKLGDHEFSVWDNFKFKNQKLQNIVDTICEKVGNLDISSISIGQFTLYNQFMSAQKQSIRLNTPVKDIFDEITENKNENINSVVLSIMFDTEEDSEPISCIIDF
jgi:ubiquitin-activating enzyme E1